MSASKRRAGVERRATPRHAAAIRVGADGSTLRLRVSLLDVEPAIWREVLVPISLTFAQLHKVLQATMGWEDYHLREFDVGGVCIGMPSPADKFFPRNLPLLDERKSQSGGAITQARCGEPAHTMATASHGARIPRGDREIGDNTRSSCRSEHAARTTRS